MLSTRCWTVSTRTCVRPEPADDDGQARRFSSFPLKPCAAQAHLFAILCPASLHRLRPCSIFCSSPPATLSCPKPF
eukprot:6187382-Pleurochrysis_carterae.AAC.2